MPIRDTFELRVQNVSSSNFGPLVAYLVPGATVLAGLSLFSPTVAGWFASTPQGAPTISGFLYLTLASLAAGMTINAVRWAIIDTIHAHTGLRMPNLDFSRLGQNVDGFALLIRIHYEHFQFFGNMFVAVGIAYACYRIKHGSSAPIGWLDLGFVILEAIFFGTSRDTLRKYYSRSHQLLGERKRDRKAAN